MKKPPPLPPQAKNMSAILALFDTPQPLGLRRREIREALPYMEEVILQAAIARMVKVGRLVQHGTLQRYRYFENQEALDAAMPQLLELIAREDEESRQRAENRAAARQLRDAAKRAEARAKSGLPPFKRKPKDAAAPAPTLARPVEHPAQRRFMGSTSVVKKRLSGEAEVITPDHVKKQIGKAFTDSRFQVDKVAQPFFSALKPGQYPLPPTFGEGS